MQEPKKQMLGTIIGTIKTLQNIVLINNSRIAWPSEIVMSFLSFSDTLLQDACYIIFQKVLIILR